MKKWKIILSVLLLLCLLCQSCFLSKKSRTMIETITVTKIDTVVKIVRDTVLKTVSVTIHDTAKIDNELSSARSYYDIKTQKIKLELKNKPFSVPVQLQKTQYVKQKEIIKEPDIFKAAWFYMFVVFLLAGIGLYIESKIKRL